jgi:hypothetical protein
MAKVICFECKYFIYVELPHWHGDYCDKIKHQIENGYAALCHAELAKCYDENGDLKAEQRKS